MKVYSLAVRPRTSAEEKSIFMAVSRGDNQNLDDMLRSFDGVDITLSVDANGYSLLHLAVYKDNEKATKRLCEHVLYGVKKKGANS